MDVKMPNSKEKIRESRTDLQDALNNDSRQTNAVTDNSMLDTAKAKTVSTQEEDDWEWLESIKEAMLDDPENEFVPPFADDVSAMSKNEQIDLTGDGAPEDKQTEKKPVLEKLRQKAKNSVRQDTAAEEYEEETDMADERSAKEQDEADEDLSFWQRIGKLVGADQASNEQEHYATAGKSRKNVELKKPVAEKKEKPVSNVKLVDNDDPWDFDDAEDDWLETDQSGDRIDLQDYMTYADDSYQDEYADIVRETMRAGEEAEEDEKSLPPVVAAVFDFLGERFHALNEKRKAAQAEEAADNVIEEANLAKEAKHYARPVGSITFRSRFAFAISILMALLAMVFELTGKGWFGIGENGVLMAGVLLVMQLMVMLLCVEIPMRGICSLINGKITAETLIAASCFISFIDGIAVLISRNADNGLPFAVVSALSVAFGMRGLRSYYIGMRNSLRIASKIQSPWGIVTDNESVEDRSVLRKCHGATDGFYKNLIRRDICEHIYTYAAPLMLIASLVFAFLSTVVRGRGNEFIHALAALVAVSASFSCMSAYSRTFRLVSAAARRQGSAIAGWTGADKIFSADGVLVTDNDLFPNGTQKVSGMKLTGLTSPYKAMEYAGSLIIASDSELKNPFREFLRENGVVSVYVDSFACYEGGGIGGVIRDDNILIGTAAFMNLMGVRIPEDIVKNDVLFLSVNRKLAAVFSVEYKPSKAVQRSLLAMRNTKMNLLLALKDFNISPKMLQHKFKVSMDGVEYIPVNDCYRMERDDVLEETEAAGIISLGGLGAFAETVAKAAQLRQITLLNTAVSLLGSAVGLFLIFYMCWNGPISSVTSWATALFMFAMHLVTIILSNMVNRRR